VPTIRRLTVEPTAGLGNRLRVLDSAVALARAVDAPLRLVWTRTPDCGAPFATLFEAPDEIEVVERSWSMSRVYRGIGAGLRYRPLLKQPDVEARCRAGFEFTSLRDSAYPYILTCSRFMPAAGVVRTLRPAGAIAAAVARVSARFDPYTIGVHGRRRDHGEAIARSPTPAFVAAMRAHVELEPRTAFYVASDDPAFAVALHVAFGERVVTRPHKLDRADPAAIADAVVDLLCLARTSRVLGSWESSFSEMAAETGGVPLEVIDVGVV
jgi:hypothetical protein